MNVSIRLWSETSTRRGVKTWWACRRLMMITLVPAVLCCQIQVAARALADETFFLSDDIAGVVLRHQQQWGEFGRNTAAAAPGRPGSPMRIGTQVFQKGLGHHANGEIIVELDGQYREFQAHVGVQWQGGNKGSVIFRVFVDDQLVLETDRMSDSDAAREIKIPIANAHQLRLVADDSGDGIGCDMANWAEPRVVRQAGIPFFRPMSITIEGRTPPPPSMEVAGVSMVAADDGPQVLLMQPTKAFTFSVRANEKVGCTIPFDHLDGPIQIQAEARLVFGQHAAIELAVGDAVDRCSLAAGESTQLRTEPYVVENGAEIRLTLLAQGSEAGVRWSRIRYSVGDETFDLPLVFPTAVEAYPPPQLPDPRPAIEQELLEWDWRMQDGIGTARASCSWQEATKKVLQGGRHLLTDLERESIPIARLASQWAELEAQWNKLSATDDSRELEWEELWGSVHRLRRQLMFQHPLADTGPLVFAKRVPSCFSHQLTQYYGMCARPGGGIFVLDSPGQSMQSRQLTQLPPGSYQQPEVSWDGEHIMFAYCEVKTAPENRTIHQDRHFHIFEVEADGSNLRQLTHGPFDDFSPTYLANGQLLFLSTRRGGYHRCGAGPCPVYTLALADANGSNPHPISFHETHEWDPAVLNDGRIIYTRWDYVDRHAVHYQQLWSARPDGSSVAAYFGNNTFNPVGVWEARPIPGSNRIMATAAAHHAMTAGSIVLLDVSKGTDGLDPITRLTPDVLFPESEFPVQQWHATAGISSPPGVPIEEQRWPGHCYRTPFPLSEDFFLAAYSFDPLIGEPNANKANMFGIYLVDRWGNKELLYRDLSIGSLWPMPLRPRPRPPALPSVLADSSIQEGTFFVENVHESWPDLPHGEENRIKHLRILQVLLKTTPHANNPKVGLANASPGKQVLGTVPVQSDGSAYFRAPAGVPLSFQALDENGMAIQTMRSLTYLQPGEQMSCVGCHEHRSSTPVSQSQALALQQLPTPITPAPDGSKPLSYPILVQPVLDQRCVSCHGDEEPAGGIALTGKPEGAFTVSYNALAPRVSYSEWKSTPAANSEPLTAPDQFGARASELTRLLLDGHEGVELTHDELQRLITWMDANALFYGTFDPDDQQRQRRGERIRAPALE